MADFSFGTLANLDLADVTSSFNLVYEEYLIPARVDETWISAHLLQNDIDLTHSTLVTDGASGEVVGLAILGVRERRGWIGGFGIAPAYRGRGVSHALMERAIADARAAGVRDLVLEVLQPNHAAIRTYERAGFERTRELRIYERSGGDRHTNSADQPVRHDPSELLAMRDHFDVPRPSWQREAPSLCRMEGLEGVSLDDGSAWAIVTRGNDRLRIFDIVARDIVSATRLLVALDGETRCARAVIVNEPSSSPVIPALAATGWSEAMHQWEMARRLV